jgi:hypothetical protein
VKVTGDVESEWTSNGGTMAVGYGPWLPESMQDPAYPADETYFIINCIGEGSDYIGFLATGDGPGVPMEATSYNLPVGTGGLSAGTQDAVEVIIGLNGPDTVWDTDMGAVLVITEFDEDHIAGTFTVPVVDGLADMTGVDNGTATLTGEFEFANPYG